MESLPNAATQGKGVVKAKKKRVIPKLEIQESHAEPEGGAQMAQLNQLPSDKKMP